MKAYLTIYTLKTHYNSARPLPRRHALQIENPAETRKKKEKKKMDFTAGNKKEILTQSLVFSCKRLKETIGRQQK